MISAEAVADEWLTQMLWQGDAKVFKKHSQMKLQMKCKAWHSYGPFWLDGDKSWMLDSKVF